MYATIICQTYKIKYTDKTPQEPVKLRSTRECPLTSGDRGPVLLMMKILKSPDDPETRLLPTG